MTRKFSNEEKQQLIANLDIEVAHRTRQLRAWLADALENFNIHQEGHVSRIPKLVRNMSMREFSSKHNGDVQAALLAAQRTLIAQNSGSAEMEIDRDTRKRKWVASQEQDAAVLEADGSGKPLKNARLMHATSPKKAGSSTGAGTAQRAMFAANGTNTPSKARTQPKSSLYGSPSPRKPVWGAAPSRSRPASPLKPSSSQVRVPSSSTFNPVLPPKTLAYPGTARLPRRDESMLSMNGSPIANPYALGWSGDENVDLTQTQTNANGGGRTLKRTKSNITIKRDPSFSFAPPSNDAKPYGHAHGLQHGRSMSHANLHFAFPSSNSNSNNNNYLQPTTPHPPPMHKRSISTSAMVQIPTKDGHMLEFDPLQTSPGSLDALEGITDSAKKQARHDMGRLVQAAVDKWRVD